MPRGIYSRKSTTEQLSLPGIKKDKSSLPKHRLWDAFDTGKPYTLNQLANITKGLKSSVHAWRSEFNKPTTDYYRGPMFTQKISGKRKNTWLYVKVDEAEWQRRLSMKPLSTTETGTEAEAGTEAEVKPADDLGPAPRDNVNAKHFARMKSAHIKPTIRVEDAIKNSGIDLLRADTVFGNLSRVSNNGNGAARVVHSAEMTAFLASSFDNRSAEFKRHPTPGQRDRLEEICDAWQYWNQLSPETHVEVLQQFWQLPMSQIVMTLKLWGQKSKGKSI